MDKVKLISVASYPISCISKEDKQFIGLSAYYVIMHFPQYKISFIFATDASDYAIEGVLSQVQDGQEKVIAYDHYNSPNRIISVLNGRYLLW